jgi:hypothetical protein
MARIRLHLQLDAGALIHAKRTSRKRFEKLVAEYRQAVSRTSSRISSALTR